MGQILLSPLTLLGQALRFAHPKRHQEFVAEAWKGRLLTPEATLRNQSAAADHVVFVGPTIGEYGTMRAVADEIIRIRPEVRVTFALRDARSIAVLLEREPDISLCYRPIEFLPIAARWNQRFRPDVVVFVEGMRFPVLAWTSFLKGSTNIVVNGRVSRRSKPHHRLRAFYFRWLFAPFAALLVQTEDHLKNARRWAPPNCLLSATGDLKALLLHLPPSSAVHEWLSPADPRPILAAGSTADAEEEAMVIEAFIQARAASPCRLLIAPRLLARVPEALERLTAQGLTVSRRTSPQEGADVLLLDSLGELAGAYSLCQAAYVGGFFHGNGHNIAEPALCGIPVSYGPLPGHFSELRAQTEKLGIGQSVSSAQDLAEHWRHVLENAGYRAQVRKQAELLNGFCQAPLKLTVEIIAGVIAGRDVSHRLNETES